MALCFEPKSHQQPAKQEKLTASIHGKGKKKLKLVSLSIVERRRQKSNVRDTNAVGSGVSSAGSVGPRQSQPTARSTTTAATTKDADTAVVEETTKKGSFINLEEVTSTATAEQGEDVHRAQATDAVVVDDLNGLLLPVLNEDSWRKPDFEELCEQLQYMLEKFGISSNIVDAAEGRPKSETALVVSLVGTTGMVQAGNIVEQVCEEFRRLEYFPEFCLKPYGCTAIYRITSLEHAHVTEPAASSSSTPS